MRTVIRNGRVWIDNEWFEGDLLISGGLLQGFITDFTHEQYADAEVYDVAGAIVVPGFIDMHVHLREPGFEDKETIETGSRAAVKGGFTTIAAMPNTKPITDTVEVLELVAARAAAVNLAQVQVIAAITCGERGETLTNFAELAAAGAIGFSDDGRGVQSAELMEQAMVEAAKLGLPIIAHCEDEEILAGGLIHPGALAEELDLPVNVSATEYAQIARDIELAAAAGAHYHVCHMSTKESVELVREAKTKGYQVTAEVTPHHLILNLSDIKEPYALYKVNPPLRALEDQIALLEGLQDGTIDIIATDHAPHTVAEKERDFIEAPFGLTGLELAFPAVYSRLVLEGIISLEELIDMLTIRPATIFGLEGGRLTPGQVADLTVIDLELTKPVLAEDLVSQGKNTPFLGETFTGWPILTMVAGDVKWVANDKTAEGEGIR